MSSCKCSSVPCKCYEVSGEGVWPGNPDPTRFVVLRTQAVGSALVAEVQYEGCTNYEGRKVLVYEKTNSAALLKLESIDPHFCDNPKCKSPVARLEPTQRGWQLALTMAAMLTRIEAATDK